VAVTNSTEIADLVATTQAELGRGAWTDLAASLQDYIALPMILTEKKVGMASGTDIRWRVRTTTSGNARMGGLFDTDETNIRNTFTEAVAPWRHARTSWGIERREVLFNRDPARIVDLVLARRSEAMIDLTILIEDRWWNGIPGASNDEDIWNVNFWINYTTPGANTFGFTGGNPSGYSTCAGIDSSTVPAWKNGVGNYSADFSSSNATAVGVLREAFVKTKFKPPVSTPNFDTGAGRGLYTNYNVISGVEEYAEAQNQNLGKDIASMDGEVLFRRMPFVWVPQLDSNSDNPIYGINWGTFHPVFLEGDYLHETPAYQSPTDHNTTVSFTDLTFNFVCRDRRQNFVLAKGDPSS
jgi:hypothetical protein